jgi:hypothetical protein
MGHITTTDMVAILEKHAIPLKWTDCFLRLVNCGRIDNAAFGNCLMHYNNWRRANVAIMQWLSRDLKPI